MYILHLYAINCMTATAAVQPHQEVENKKKPTKKTPTRRKQSLKTNKNKLSNGWQSCKTKMVGPAVKAREIERSKERATKKKQQKILYNLTDTHLALIA